MVKKFEAPKEEVIFEYEPNIHDVHRYFDNYIYKGKPRGVIGNDEARTLIPLVFGLRGVSVVIRGASGSGKTTILKCATQMLWGDDALLDKVPEVLYMAGASKKGWLTNTLADRIKYRCTHAIAPELQNIIIENDIAEAMIKLWTENEAYTYTRADNFGKNSNRMTLEPLPILTSIATENPKAQRLGEEMERRFFPFYTIASRDTNEKVHIMKADSRALPDEDLITMSDEDKLAIRFHLQSAMAEKLRVKNPLAPFIRKIVPNSFVVSNSMIDLLFDSVEAVTQFYYPDRVKTNGGTNYTLSTPVDNWYAFVLGGEALVLASMNIPDLGKEIINILPTRNEDSPDVSMCMNDIVDELMKKGLERPKKQVEQIIRSLEAVNYAKRDDYAKDAIYKTQTYQFDRQIDWRIALETAKKTVKTVYPEISKDYILEHCEDPEMVHPFTGKKIKLLDFEPETEGVATVDLDKILGGKL